MITKTRSLGCFVGNTFGYQSFRTSTWTSSPWFPPPTPNPYIHSAPVSSAMPAGSESIEYTVDRVDNYCKHTKTSFETFQGNLQQNNIYAGYNGGNRYYNLIINNVAVYDGYTGSYEYGKESFFPAVPNVGFLTASTWRSLSAQAVRSMMPGIQSNVSSLNFLYELRELKDLPQQLQRLFRAASLVTGMNRRLSVSAVKKGLTTLRSGGETNLLWEFGLKPLWSDLQALWQAVHGASSEAQAMLAGIGKVQKRHYRQWISVPADTTHTYTSEANWQSVRKRKVVWTKSWYTATMYYHYDLDPITRRHLILLSNLDKFGLNFNPRIIWDALPWSFLVDWVVKVGPFLDQFKIRNVEPRMVITRFVHSYSAERQIQRFYALYPTLAAPNEVPTGIKREVSYYREPYVPDFYSALQLSGVSTREFILSGSLMAARIKP